MEKNLKHARQNGVDTLWRMPKIGRRLHRCNFYEADSSVNDDNNTVVFEVSFAEAMRTLNGKQAACYFGSALCAFCPSLLSVVKNALEDHGMDLTVIKLPSGADDAELKLDDYDKYNPIEISTLIGSWLIMIFECDLKVNACTINNTVSGLAEELGVPNEKIPDLKSHFQVPQVIAIRNAFCANIDLKEDVKNFLFWLKERKGMVATMARHLVINWFY